MSQTVVLPEAVPPETPVKRSNQTKRQKKKKRYFNTIETKLVLLNLRSTKNATILRGSIIKTLDSNEVNAEETLEIKRDRTQFPKFDKT